MFSARRVLGAVAVLAVVACAAHATVMTVTLGDVDGLGFGLTSGQTLTTFPFDNRTASDPAFTDFGAAGETDAAFTFNYAPIAGTITAASLEFGLAGLEDLRSDTPTAVFDDRLYLDGSEIPGAFDNDYTGILTYGVIPLTIPSNLFGLFSDGTAGFFFDGWPSGTSTTVRFGDQVSFDYVRLSIEYAQTSVVPAPPALVLGLLGIVVALAPRLRRRAG